MRGKGDRYIVRKYIMANSAMGAIRQDKKTPVHDCWIDDEWKKKEQLSSCIGFTAETKEDEDD